MEHKIWFVGDTHLGHDKDFIWANRGFASVQEHDTKIIENWNKYIAPEDEVYHLGDVMLGNDKHGLECLKQLNGHIHLIRGNHDTDNRVELFKQCENIVEIVYATELKYKKYYFFLSHYPAVTANYDDDKPWAKHLMNIHAHTHQREAVLYDTPYRFCVSLDATDNKPVDIEYIISALRTIKEYIDTNKNLD